MIYRVLTLMLVFLFLVGCSDASDDANDLDSSDTPVEVVDNSSETDVEETDVDESNDETDEDIDNEAGDSFTMVVTGAEEFEWDKSDPLVSCQEDQLSVVAILASPYFGLFLPATVEPGTYPLADFNPNTEDSYVEGSAVLHIRGEFGGGIAEGAYGTSYIFNSEGEVIIESVPSDFGESIVASFNAYLEDREGNAVNVVGSLNLQETMSTTDCVAFQ